MDLVFAITPRDTYMIAGNAVNWSDAPGRTPICLGSILTPVKEQPGLSFVDGGLPIGAALNEESVQAHKASVPQLPSL